jgi:hypothetical protein
MIEEGLEGLDFKLTHINGESAAETRDVLPDTSAQAP